MQLSHYIKIYPSKEKPGHSLLFSTKTGAVVLLSDGTLRAARNGALSAKTRDTLSRLGFLVGNADEERRSMLGYLDAANAKDTHMNAIVVMTLDCNLACRYCFEGTMKGKHYMSRETADQLVGFIDRSLTPGRKTLNVDFYGGEPLLHFGLVKSIARRLGEVAERKAVKFTFTLVTNGTLLTRKRALELSGLGLKSVKLTLDGPKESHDGYRPYKSGRGSFERILRNIREVNDIVKVVVGGNYEEENYREFPRLLDRLMEEGLTPERLSMVKFDAVVKGFKDVAPKGFDGGCSSISEPWFLEAGLYLHDEILRRGYNTPKMLPTRCMVYMDGQVEVNYNGDIYKCPGLLGRKEFVAGDVVSGVGDFGKAYNSNNWKNDRCLKCEYLPMCFGGCRFMKLMEDGNLDGVACERAYNDHSLEAIILQEMKYGGGSKTRPAYLSPSGQKRG